MERKWGKRDERKRIRGKKRGKEKKEVIREKKGRRNNKGIKGEEEQ